MIDYKDIQKVELEEEEIQRIDSYIEEKFPIEQISRKSSQFEYSASKYRNPNFLGVIGEWAMFKRYSDTSLDTYLSKRRLYQSDDGDGVASGFRFDIKTSTSNSLLKEYNYARWRGTVQEKHIEKEFIDIFIFAEYSPSEKCVYIMGYIEKENLIQIADNRKKGEVYGNYGVKADCYSIQYGHLQPMALITTEPIDMIE